MFTLATTGLLVNQDFSLPIAATILWLTVFDAFCAHQAMTGGMLGVGRFDYHNARWKLVDRTQLNMSEQNILFIGLVWLHALFVDAQLAGFLGCIASVFRYTYPLLRMLARNTRPAADFADGFILVELSTQPYWFCLNTLKANLLAQLVTGAPLVHYETLGVRSLGLMTSLYVGVMLLTMVLMLPLYLAARLKYTDQGAAKDKAP